MIKEELYAIIEDERKQLDLPSPSGITLKWVSNLFSDLSKLTCSYSYTFKLPMTRNNKEVLDMCNDIRKGSSLPRKVVNAEFYVNGINFCPNANLYVSEIADTFSCVLTWRVLKAFQTLKEDDKNINELSYLGKIVWGGTETYGGTGTEHGNTDSVLYPDHDAGVPHQEATPPRPCVPIYKIVQMINQEYGVKFNVGRAITNHLGLLPAKYFNNKNYYNKYVYDDYISNGVIPLTEASVDATKYEIRELSLASCHSVLYGSLQLLQTWKMAVFKPDFKNMVYRRYFYQLVEGSYMDVTQDTSETLSVGIYLAPTVAHVGIPIFETFTENQYIKPVSCYVNQSCNRYVNDVIKPSIDACNWILSHSEDRFYEWNTITILLNEDIDTQLSSDYTQEVAVISADDKGSLPVQSIQLKADKYGYRVGVCGFFPNVDVTLYGNATMHISKAAVDAGRVDVSTYMWICVVSTKGNLHELEAVTSKDTGSYIGCQSTDIPTYDAINDCYVCHFDFGHEYPTRTIQLDAITDEEIQGYLFLPYVIDDDYVLGTYQEGDFSFEEFNIDKIVPAVEVSTLPATLVVTSCLPNISCFNFMKALFYMNGAMPKVEKDGTTISAMYYNQLRDRMNEGEAVDWSDKLLATMHDGAKSVKFHNTSYGQDNYLEMASSQKDKTNEEINEDVDRYDKGYGSLHIDDESLEDDKSIYSSPFNPPYLRNYDYPTTKVGRTYKLWDGDTEHTMKDSITPVYGISNYRALNNLFEDTSVLRPGLSYVTDEHIRMDVFSPFDNSDLMQSVFGYLKAILNNYVLIKEKFNLTELDLLNFDESMPVYLAKYNSYFAVSTIQRDKLGVCTVELVKLPKQVAEYAEYEPEKEQYETYEVVTEGNYLQLYSDYTLMYKASADDTWHELTDNKIMLNDTSIYMIAADTDYSLAGVVYSIDVVMDGKYIATIHKGDSIIRTEERTGDVTAYVNGEECRLSSGADVQMLVTYVHFVDPDGYGDGYDEPYARIKVVIALKNDKSEVASLYSWYSPVFVSRMVDADAYPGYLPGDPVDRMFCNKSLIEFGSYGSSQCVLYYTYTDENNKVASVNVTTDADASLLEIKNVTTGGFTVENLAAEIASTYMETDEYKSYNVIVNATLEDGTELNTITIPVRVYIDHLCLESQSVIQEQDISLKAKNGILESFTAYVIEKVVEKFIINNVTSITSSNDKLPVTVNEADVNGISFSLGQSETLSQNETTDITVIVPAIATHSGKEMTGLWHVTAVYSNNIITVGSVTVDADLLDENVVSIIDVDNNLYTTSEWQALSTKPTPLGVALSNGTVRLIFAPTCVENKDIDQVESITNEYTFANGDKGVLPDIIDLKKVIINDDDICSQVIAACKLIGTPFVVYTDVTTAYWTSGTYAGEANLIIHNNNKTGNVNVFTWDGYKKGIENSSFHYFVRPVIKLS